VLRLQLLQRFRALPRPLLHGVRSAAFSAVQIIAFVSNLRPPEVRQWCPSTWLLKGLTFCFQFSMQKWRRPSSFKNQRQCFLPCVNSARRVFVKVPFPALSRRIQSTSGSSQGSTHPTTTQGELGESCCGGNRPALQGGLPGLRGCPQSREEGAGDGHLACEPLTQQWQGLNYLWRMAFVLSTRALNCVSNSLPLLSLSPARRHIPAWSPVFLGKRRRKTWKDLLNWQVKQHRALAPRQGTEQDFPF